MKIRIFIDTNFFIRVNSNTKLALLRKKANLIPSSSDFFPKIDYYFSRRNFIELVFHRIYLLIQS